jgi:hypothetical protein
MVRPRVLAVLRLMTNSNLVGEDGGGNWYYSAQLDLEGWLCPALLRYFAEAPKQLYVQAKGRK